MMMRMRVAGVVVGPLLGVLGGQGAVAFTGSDPVYQIRDSCKLGQVTARLGPDGAVYYSIAGSCHGTPVTGELAYAADRRMAERFFYRGAEIRSSAVCPDDPWVTGAQCDDSQISAQGADPGGLIYQQAPLSRWVLNAADAFHDARRRAARPSPPGPPVNPRADVRWGRRANVSWLGPDQTGSQGPYLGFVIEGRPRGAEGAAWTSLGGMAKHPAPDYRLSVDLPEPVSGYSGWELRACATTVLDRSCSAPFVPTLASVGERRGKDPVEVGTTPPLTLPAGPDAWVRSAPIGPVNRSEPAAPPASAVPQDPPPVRSFGKYRTAPPVGGY